MSSPLITMNGGLAGAFPAIRFRRNAIVTLRPATVRPVPFVHRSGGRLVTQARAKRGGKQEPEEEVAESKTGLFSGLFGDSTGTQRLKAGQPESKPSSKQSPKQSPPKAKKSAPANFLQTTRIGRKDQNTVFVAGATGRLGLRIVRELLSNGFKVRAGARNTQKAQDYVDYATSLGILSGDAAKRLQIVPVDLEDPGSISAALGNATRVVQAIGAADNNVLDFGGPKRIDNQAAVDLVNASVEAGITQYVMVTSLGTGKFGWPASALNLFGGILTQKRKAEKALEASGLNFTIVRPGGMERPGDDYKKTNNLRLSEKDKLFGGQVSRLQVAELITSALINPELAGNKTLEVVAEKNAPKVDYEDLLRNFGVSNLVTDPEPQVEEDEIKEPRTRPSRPPKKAPPKRTPPPKQASADLSGNQNAIAEDIAKKEIDIKLKKDAPEPSQESKNVAEDIAKAEINIDSGKENPTKNWFGLGRSKGSEKLVSTPKKAQSETPSTSGKESNPIEAVQDTVKSVTKQVQSPDDLERLREARSKTLESRAQKEAEFLARMESQRQEEAAKKKQAAEKREKEALEKSRKDRDTLLQKQEEQQNLFRDQEAKRTAAIAERVKADKAKSQSPESTKPQLTQDAGAAQQAKENAQEARKWIDEWRASQKGGNGSTPSKSSPLQAAKAEPSENGSKPVESKNGASSENAPEARKWIEDWRSRSAGKS